MLYHLLVALCVAAAAAKPGGDKPGGDAKAKCGELAQAAFACLDAASAMSDCTSQMTEAKECFKTCEKDKDKGPRGPPPMEDKNDKGPRGPPPMGKGPGGPPKEGPPPKEGSPPMEEGGPPPKEAGPPPEEGGPPPEEGGSPPKEETEGPPPEEAHLRDDGARTMIHTTSAQRVEGEHGQFHHPPPLGHFIGIAAGAGLLALIVGFVLGRRSRAAPAVITKKAVQPVAPKVLVGKYVDERSPEVKEAAAVIAQAEAIGKPAPYDECCA